MMAAVGYNKSVMTTIKPQPMRIKERRTLITVTPRVAVRGNTRAKMPIGTSNMIQRIRTNMTSLIAAKKFTIRGPLFLSDMQQGCGKQVSEDHQRQQGIVDQRLGCSNRQPLHFTRSNPCSSRLHFRYPSNSLWIKDGREMLASHIRPTKFGQFWSTI